MADAINAGAVVILVIVTGIYVWLTHRLARNANLQSEIQIRAARISALAILANNERSGLADDQVRRENAELERLLALLHKK
jgi:hypothetical protein